MANVDPTDLLVRINEEITERAIRKGEKYFTCLSAEVQRDLKDTVPSSIMSMGLADVHRFLSQFDISRRDELKWPE